MPEINDENTSAFWDEHFQTADREEVFPLSEDRNKLIAEQLELSVTGLSVESVKKLTAFSDWYRIKTLVNSVFLLLEPNNLITFCYTRITV